MTEAEQRYLDNEKLVYHAVNTRFPTYSNNEDVLQEARIILWDVCNRSEEEWTSRGMTFANYAIRTIQWQLLRQMFTKQSNFEENHSSLDAKPGNDDDENKERYELIPDNRTHVIWLDNKPLLEHFRGKRKKMAAMLLSGKNLRDVGKACGCSYQNAQYVRAKLMEIIEKNAVLFGG